MDKIFRSAILESSQEKKQEHFFYRRISSALKRIPDGYKELFERNSQEMDVSQRVITDLL